MAIQPIPASQLSVHRAPAAAAPQLNLTNFGAAAAADFVEGNAETRRIVFEVFEERLFSLKATEEVIRSEIDKLRTGLSAIDLEIADVFKSMTALMKEKDSSKHREEIAAKGEFLKLAKEVNDKDGLKQTYGLAIDALKIGQEITHPGYRNFILEIFEGRLREMALIREQLEEMRKENKFQMDQHLRERCQRLKEEGAYFEMELKAFKAKGEAWKMQADDAFRKEELRVQDENKQREEARLSRKNELDHLLEEHKITVDEHKAAMQQDVEVRRINAEESVKHHQISSEERKAIYGALKPRICVIS